MSLAGKLSRPVDLTPATRWVRRRVLDRPAESLLWLGVALRLAAYLGNRPYWLDETSLLSNLVLGPILDFSRPLGSDQLAPFGFLIAQRVIVALLGASTYATRLLPLACGLAALWLFRDLASRLLDRVAAPVAMALFACSADLIYYASELKPYSSDLALTLLITNLNLAELRRPPGRSRPLPAGLLAAASPWLSFPSAFVAAGCGLVLLVDRLGSGRRRDSAWLAGYALAWSISAGLALVASRRLLGAGTSMYVFWDFAFLPPPVDRASLSKIAGILLEVFVTPLNLASTPLPAAFAALAVALWAAGVASMARRDPRELALLLAPLALALAASALRRYPFHGRLILWLAPCFFLLIAEGTQALRARLPRPAYLAVLALLLIPPALDALSESAGWSPRDFNVHGDLRDNQFMD